MPDMLVKLYELPPLAPVLERMATENVEVRRALAPEQRLVSGWVAEQFNAAWASECEVAFARQPAACFVATQDQTLLGFACYDAVCRGFFGPTGVSESTRGRGIGSALLLLTLHAMRDVGYGYAIIGGAGPTDFYQRMVGATAIEGSAPGIYQGMLWKPQA